MIDLLILGQGLAGSWLAYVAHKNGLTVTVIDNGHNGSATKVAAGLVDAITGKRFSLTEGVPESINETVQFYRELETEWGASLYTDNIHSERLFIDALNKEKYAKRKDWPEFSQFYAHEIKPGGSQLMTADLGGVILKHSGLMNTNIFLETARKILIQKDAYKEIEVNWDDIVISEDIISIDDIQAKRVVDCRGFQASTNPLFPELHYRNAKGEVLILKLNEPVSEIPAVYNQRYWLARQHNGLYKFGATYEWDDLTPIPTKSGYNELISAAHILIRPEFEVLDHIAAVRCIPKKNIPYAMWHNTHKNVGIFTGLGSKGVMLAPKYARILLESQ
ncbi:MAG: FAD-binding oxidoreductase [bacterium]|nr:FAD-binding oxidoreductase [bacterium]